MTIAILLSGGTGLRLGAEIPKQYIEAGGRPILCYSLECLSLHAGIDGIRIVADPAWQQEICRWLLSYDPENKFCGFSLPGENRQLSIYHALEDLKDLLKASDSVFIHDAARPRLSAKQITDCLAALKGYEGVVPMLPMKDTVYLSQDGKQITSLLKRSEVFAGQAPELFHFGKYYEANQRLLPADILRINGSAEPAVMAGMNIAMIPGDENNYKITTRADLERFQRAIQEQSEYESERNFSRKESKEQ